MKKIIVIGPGLIGKKHIELIDKNADLSLCAIVAPHIKRYGSFAKEYNVPLYDKLETALLKEDPDAVLISSPNQYHYEQARICIEQKIPILVEKPLTSCLKEAKELVNLSKTSSVPILVGDHRVHNALLKTAKQFINSNAFGKPVSFMGSAQFHKPAHYFREGEWRTKIGGGPILINMIHEVGIMRELFGEIKKVSAFSSNHIRKFEVEDTVAINIEFENGALGTFMLSDTAASNKSWEMTTGENPAYPSYPHDTAYHIAGTLASLDFPNMRIRKYANTDEASWWKPFNDDHLPIVKSNPLEDQLKHFVEVLEGKAEPLASAYNGFMNIVVIEAIKQSINENRFVYISEVLNRI